MTGDGFEALLEEALGEVGGAEPRAGMQRRVMARVRSEGRGRRAEGRLGWAVAALLVAGSVWMTGGLTRREERRAAPVEVARGTTEQQPARAVPEGDVKVRRVRRVREAERGQPEERETVVPLEMDDLRIEPLSVE